jgi:hypothetical protein
MKIFSTLNQCTVSAAAAYTTSGHWLLTQGCYKQALFTCLLTQTPPPPKAYASQGNLEQTINCICDAQTLNQGSDFVKGPDFHFLNAGKTLNQGKLCITYTGLLLGRQKINTKCGKTLDRETLNRGSTVYCMS